MIVESFFLLVSSAVALFYGDGDFNAFVQSAAISLAFGGVIYLFTCRCSREVGKREAFLVVSLVWVVFSTFGALPFLLGGYINGFTDAFFETISGFTTTGASIINDIEALPHGILFWRSLTHLLGGMGILVLTVAILPIFGFGVMSLFSAEAAGITGSDLDIIKADAYPHFLHVMAILFVLNVIIMLIIGKIKPRTEEFKLEYTEQVDITPWKYVKQFGIAICIIVVFIYVYFSPLVTG